MAAPHVQKDVTPFFQISPASSECRKMPEVGAIRNLASLESWLPGIIRRRDRPSMRQPCDRLIQLFFLQVLTGESWLQTAPARPRPSQSGHEERSDCLCAQHRDLDQSKQCCPVKICEFCFDICPRGLRFRLTLGHTLPRFYPSGPNTGNLARNESQARAIRGKMNPHA